MPELPEVETVRRTVVPHIVGRRIVEVTVRDARLRRPVDEACLRDLLLGRQVVRVRRRAKYLLFDTDPVAASPATVLLVHLGMSGVLGVTDAARPLRLHDHVLIGLEGGRQLRLNDARRFGLVEAFAATQEGAHPRLHGLGVEPLDAQQFGGQALFAMSRGVGRPVKTFLMDARHVVGVGNIYACESLWAAGIHPSRAAGRLSVGRCRTLAEAVRATLACAIEQGGTTLRDFTDVDGSAGYFAVRLKVYGREGQPCSRCGRAVRRAVQAGRATFYCPGCQR